MIALHGEGVASSVAILAQILPPHPSADTVLARECQYFRSHEARTDYPTFHAQALSLGSGAVESAGKHLLPLRMKRAGARWSGEGRKGVLAVRCRLASNRPLAA